MAFEFANRGMAFVFEKAAWLGGQYLKKKLDFFGGLSIEAQNALLISRLGSPASVGDEGLAPPTASNVAGDGEDDDDRDLECAVGPDKVKRVGAKLD